MATGMNEPVPGEGPAITHTKLIKLLECPVCFETMTESVYQCETGHSVCYKCKTKLDKCGVCQKKFTGTRNYIAEQSAESLIFYCKHKEYGCAIVNTRQELFWHQTLCPYRPVLCNDIRKTPCKNNPMKLDDFFPHLKNVHECPEIDYKDGSFTLIHKSVLDKNKEAGMTYYVKFDKKYFVLETLFDENTVDWWVYLIGTSKQAEKYQYELTVLPIKRNQNMEIKYKLPVSSIFDQNNKTWNWNGGFASCPKVSLMSFSITEGTYPNHVWKWNTALKIIKLKEDPVAQSNYPPLKKLRLK